MKRIYVAGPISLKGKCTSEEIKAFLNVFTCESERLRSLGYEVENPGDNEAPADPCWPNWMRLGIAQLITCDTIALLPQWERSEGAKFERDIAERLGMTVVLASDIKDMKE